MRTIALGLAVLLTVTFAGLPARAGDEPASRVPLHAGGTDLATNADFETGGGDAPAGWRIYTPAGAMRVTWGTHGLAGSKGLLFEAPEEGARQGVHASVGQLLPAGSLEADKEVEVTVWVRLTDFQGACILWARCDEEGRPERREGAFENSQIAGYEPKGSTLWSPMTVRVVPGAATRQLVFGLLVGGEGRVQIDAFSARVRDKWEAPTAPKREPVGPGLYRAEGRYGAFIVEDAESMRVRIPVPILWREQVPLDFRAWTEPAEHLGSVKLVRRKHGFHYAEVELVDLKKDAKLEFFWEGHVLALPHTPTPIPEGIVLPLVDVPDEAKPWLAATWCVDAKDEAVAKLAAEIREAGDTADVVIPTTLARMRKVFSKATGHVDALTASEAMTKRGSCTSCANLGAALLRAHGIPARVIAGYPTWSGPLQTHYVVEYWLPKGGWRLMESTMCEDDRPSYEQIEVAMVLPEDETEPVARLRATAAGGVPRLSMTEYPDYSREDPPPARLFGNMPDRRGCDHRAVKVRLFDAPPEVWTVAATRAAERWRRLTGAAVADEEAVRRLAPVRAALDATDLETLVDALAAN